MMKISLLTLLRSPFLLKSALRNFSTQTKQCTKGKMLAWQIHSYGGLDELKLQPVSIPALTKPSEVLIKVTSASINPIDLAMMGGYGSTIFNLMRKVRNCSSDISSDIEFPLILGRDFSGVIVSKGHQVNNLDLDDEVWGVIPIECQGSHAHYVKVDASLVRQKPKNLTDIEAASMLYAGLTAWSALWYTGGFSLKSTLSMKTDKPVLVLGASGGVGTLAVQLLKAWNINVIATCSEDAVDLLNQIGADLVINYRDNMADSDVISNGPYHIILDCCNQGLETIRSKGYPHSTYITLNSPLLKNVDENGLLFGSLKNLSTILEQNVTLNENRSFVKWGFFAPSSTGIETIQKLVEANQMRPIVQEVFDFEDIQRAYERVSQGHLRGKVVIKMT